MTSESDLVASPSSPSVDKLFTQFESSRLAKDLEDCRKACLSVLMALLALHSITASTSLGVAILALMLYTISLHISVAAGASRLGVVVFTVLHAIPAAGIFVVTSAELAFTVKSPAVAISIIILCFFPTILTVLQYLHMATSGNLPPKSEPNNV